MAKTAAKKKVSTPRGFMKTSAAKVLAELSFAVAQGMHDGLLADPQHRRYVLVSAARDYWLDGHAKSVPKALRLKGRLWSKDRRGVLMMATILGHTAVDLAYKKAGAAKGLVRVTKSMARAATKTVQKDPRCVAFARRVKKPHGGGVYCEF